MQDIKNFFLEINLNEKHKKLTHNNNVYFVGGIIFLVSIFFTSTDFSLKFFCLLIYTLGLFSDKKYLYSPNLRLIIQTLIIILSIYLLDVRVDQTRIHLLDYFLNFKFFSIIFTAFCLLILINGSNFIDGININLICYYLLITIIFYYLSSTSLDFDLEKKDLLIIIISLVVILILNLLGKITSGDGGAYLISFFWGINLINLFMQNQHISPFFIVLLLWYPAFENLFSIIRKLKLNKSALNADFKHFHQLLYLVINSKIKNKKIANNISGLIISFYNFIIFLISINYYHHTQTLVILILFSVFIYLVSYLKLLSNLRRNSKKHLNHF